MIKENIGIVMASPIPFLILISLTLSGLYGTSVSHKQEVTTIKTKHGIYDCVDFYKQPAFNNPLLKNLTYKVPKNKLVELQGESFDNEIGLEDGGCPIGTVPILRLTSNSSHFPHATQSNGESVAVVQTIYREHDPTKDFYGVDAKISLYKPFVLASHWSSARLKLINEPESMEVGWMVNPRVYNDYEAHLYVALKTVRPECSSGHPCFVQVGKEIPIGLVPKKYSEIKRTQWYWNLFIEKHQDDGNWWLSLIHDKQYIIGYWPKEALGNIAYVASQVEWGGAIGGGEPGEQLPAMGSGLKADYNPHDTAHIWHITVVKYIGGVYQYVTPGPDTKKVMNYKEYYTVTDSGYKGAYYGRIMNFGGPWM